MTMKRRTILRGKSAGCVMLHSLNDQTIQCLIVIPPLARCAEMTCLAVGVARIVTSKTKLHERWPTLKSFLTLSVVLPQRN
jgi:hypothetical protein